MLNTSTTHILNEKNNQIIAKSIDKVEVRNYQNEFDIDLLAYIPFLHNSSNIDMLNLREEILYPDNLISNNGTVRDVLNQDPNELVIDLNGDFQFQPTNEKKDLYYKYSYKTNSINTLDNETQQTSIGSAKYIDEDTWHDIMFYFETDTLTPRVIGVFNNSAVLSIVENVTTNNEVAYFLEVVIRLVDISTRSEYLVKLHDPTELKANTPIHIGLSRVIRKSSDRYYFILFINGLAVDDQKPQNDYHSYKLIEELTKIYPDNTQQSLFWFHEEPNIKTSIDEIYLYTLSDYSLEMFFLPTKHQIIPFPIHFVTKSSTTRNVKGNIIQYVYRNVLSKLEVGFDVRRNYIYINKEPVKRLVLLSNPNKLPLAPTSRKVTSIKTINFHTNIEAMLSIKFDTNIKLENLVTKYNLKTFINKTIKVKFNTCLEEKDIYHFDTNIKSIMNIKFKTSLQQKMNFKNLCKYNSLIVKEESHPISRNVKSKIIVNSPVTRELIPDGTVYLPVKRIISKKMTTIFDQDITDYDKLDLKPLPVYRNVVYRDDDNPLVNPIHRTVVKTIKIPNILTRLTKNIVTVYFQTLYRNSDLDIYIFPVTRIIKKPKTILFNNILHRRISIPFKSRSNIYRNILNGPDQYGHNPRIKPVDLSRIIEKQMTFKTDTILKLAPGNFDTHTISRNVTKTIRLYNLTMRRVENRTCIPWAFVLDTTHYI